jgi:hypothetical protein
MTTRYNVIYQLNAAIRELQEAKRYVKKRYFERAEDEIGDSLQYIGRSLRKINRLEYTKKRKHKRHKRKRKYNNE